MSKISLTFDSLKQAYLDGAWTVEVLIRHLNEVIESRGEDSVWISRVAKKLSWNEQEHSTTYP